MLACLSYAENIVECYDFESGQWILLTERPVDVPHYGSEAVTACGSKFYAVGGLQSRSELEHTLLPAMNETQLQFQIASNYGCTRELPGVALVNISNG